MVKIKINRDAISRVVRDLPYGEARTETEVARSIRNEENEEHDYMLDLYQTALDEIEEEKKHIKDVKKAIKGTQWCSGCNRFSKKFNKNTKQWFCPTCDNLD